VRFLAFLIFEHQQNTLTKIQ